MTIISWISYSLITVSVYLVYLICNLHLCLLAFFKGIFPERLKYATIVPVYKKGDKNIVTNYRPISTLTSFNKIFEKVM
jgi:hypothetical protein